MENQATMSDFDSILASRGVTRRSFMTVSYTHLTLPTNSRV